MAAAWLTAEFFLKWLDKRFFLVFMVGTILAAYAYPNAGAKNGVLQPKITTGWIAVCIVFLLSGWSLKTKELVNAALYVRLNVFVQGFNLAFIPFTIYGLVAILQPTNINEVILEGMVIMACVPSTVSMCVVLTKAAGGNDAASVFNAAFGNLLGILVTPALVLLLVGSKMAVSFQSILFKLLLKVFVPLCLGQVIQYAGGRDFYTRHKKRFKRLQEVLLLCIVYTTFCETFYKGFAVGTVDVVTVLAIQVVLYLFYCGSCFWFTSLSCFKFSRPDRISILFCATHKTVAMGIPLLNTMFEGNNDLGIYVIPLLLYHPMQLFLGSLFIGRLSKWAELDRQSDVDENLGHAQEPKNSEDPEYAVVATTKSAEV